MTPLEKIAERVSRNGVLEDTETPAPLLELDEFFEGNDVVGSIGCNLAGPPPPPLFYELFKKIADRDDVERVVVEINAFDDPDWPFSDTVWIITSKGKDEVASWFPEDLKPDECWVGWIEGRKYEDISIPDGMDPVACWYD